MDQIDDEFLSRLYDLSNMPSSDYRYKDAAGDIYQHCVRNSDWNTDWVFYDDRFNLLHAPDGEFLKFLCETLHPVVRPSNESVAELLRVYNDELAGPTFSPQPTGRAALFDKPTTWQKVDRQLKEMQARLDSATTEEQYQTVGLLCREVLISVARRMSSIQLATPQLMTKHQARPMLSACSRQYSKRN